MEGMTKFETIGCDYLANEQLGKFYVQTYGNNYLGIVNDISRYFTINAHGTLTFYKNALRCRGSGREKMSFLALNIQNGVKSKNFEDFNL